MISTVITSERHGAVAVVTIDRHERRNALDLEHLDALHDALQAAVGEGGARCVVLTGAGSAFCAGADLDAVYGTAFREALARTLRALTEVAVPVVAAVNGPAVGAGTQLAIACDLRVVAPRARFAVPTARNALAVDPWTVRRLAEVAGGGPARALLLGVDTVDAERALGVGLADRAGGLDVALAWAAEIATLAPLSLAYAKLALGADAASAADVDRAFARCWASADLEEYRAARRDGRDPVYTGR